MKGRASVVTDLGDGRVLRVGGEPEREARLMAHAAAHGYPVPAVHEVRDGALVLERLDGPTMAEELRRRPWTLATQARTLAELHRHLHTVEHPDGGTLVHRDLHPENVLLTSRGPVVIDWTNAGSGDAAVDDALTWVILRTSAGAGGRALAFALSRRLDTRTGLDGAVAYRLADPNVTALERARVQALLGEVLEREQVVPVPIERAFSFYADPLNLEAITPPWLHFRIVEAPRELQAGAVLRYRLRLFGVPISWTTEIAEWSPPHGFVDVQTHGPYRRWEHTHTLEPAGAGATRIRDRVRYETPLGRAVVRRLLRAIFDFRAAATHTHLG